MADSNIVCYHCGNKGHITRNCTNPVLQ
jgi:hypothetical protein